jgi:hypothetical protein
MPIGVYVRTGHSHNFINLTSRQFGRLLVLKYAGKNRQGKALWECHCDCGNSVIVLGDSLCSGRTKSCGCSRVENAAKGSKASITHGHTRNGKRSPEYYTWSGMTQRCTNPHRWNFKDYGGRGIQVCRRWCTAFATFFADMGPKPTPKHRYSLDRWPNNDGNYEPGNCRWATRSQQSSNQRPRKLSKKEKQFR